MKQENAYEMRWNCLERGCFNHKKRVKFDVFAGAFPGRINFSDVDGIVEINGKALLLEMKEAPIALPTGQRILYERLTNGTLVTVLMVAGDARDMRLSHFGYVWEGKVHAWRPGSTEEVSAWIGRWVSWAKQRSEVAA